MISILSKNFCDTQSAFVAGGVQDGAAVTGITIDRNIYDSAIISIPWTAILANGQTFSLAVEYQTSSDGTTWGTATTLQAATVEATGTATVTSFSGTRSFEVDLSSLSRYFRVNYTPSLSATSADECGAITGTIELGDMVTAEGAVAALIAAAGVVGVSTVNVYRGPEGAVDETAYHQLAVFVAEYGGTEHYRFLGSTQDYKEVTCQVVIRSDMRGYSVGGDIARAILEAVHEATLTDFISCSTVEPVPQYLGREGEQQHRWTFDVSVRFIG